jgi:hypothetical protein
MDPKLLENPLYASTSLNKESTPLLPDNKTTRLLRLITAKPPGTFFFGFFSSQIWFQSHDSQTVWYYRSWHRSSR